MLRLRTYKDLMALKRAIKAGDDILVEAYRLANRDGGSYYFPNRKPTLTTKKGAILRVKRPNRNIYQSCGAGVNVATMYWCADRCYCSWSTQLFSWSYIIWAVRFRTRDVACIPRMTDGKFRLYKCKVVHRVRTVRYRGKTCKVRT